ncbi:hypothetical protein [Alteromonas halophila]|uniref:Uncharacterized protein n=1 Tax=Alteromonas halophila TaxID=516698 RepID=A0A918JM48_9ALTE|nr:hypothetical protein [Alteromonas halophila]GGW89343.1 hypothetical protein GCM10007391_24470 [Alteromonas halophila]
MIKSATYPAIASHFYIEPATLIREGTKGDGHCPRNLPSDYALQDSLRDNRLIRIFSVEE